MLDSEISQKLRERYNPDGSDLRHAQMIMLDMLKYLDSICREHYLRYWLDAGSLIGALRHGGFIPWDDDMDIAMPREDYLKLRQILLKEKGGRYVLQDFTTDPGYAGCWIVLRDTLSEYLQDGKLHSMRKYRGVQVDIFPLEDRVNPFLAHIASKLEFNRLNDAICNAGLLPVMRARCIFHSKIFFPLLRFLSHLLPDTNDNYRYSYGIPWVYDMPQEWIFPLKKARFEDFDACVPSCGEAYLKFFYGEDVLELQPEKDRKTHHCQFVFFD